MKIKILALICIAMMLIGMFAGCGTETTEEALQATEATQTYATETTAATVETTVPEETVSIYEEHDITLWEGCEPELTTYEKYRTLQGEYKNFGGMRIDSYKDKKGTKLASGYIARSDMSVAIREYSSDCFGWNLISEPMEMFYQAYRETEDASMNRQEWRESHKDYKLLHICIRENVYTSDIVDTILARDEKTFSFYNEPLYIADLETQKLWVSNSSIPNIVATDTIEIDGKECEISAYHLISQEWLYNSETNNIGDMKVTKDIFVLLPKDHEGLAFAYCENINITQETAGGLQVSGEESAAEEVEKQLIAHSVDEFSWDVSAWAIVPRENDEDESLEENTENSADDDTKWYYFAMIGE